jgi:hypothetical protein
MSVNLDRLREARFAFSTWFIDTGPWGDEIADTFNEWCDLLDAAMDAPRVWWCESHESAMWRDVIGDGEWHCDRKGLPLYRDACKRVRRVLVPVEGEGK